MNLSCVLYDLVDGCLEELADARTLLGLGQRTDGGQVLHAREGVAPYLRDSLESRVHSRLDLLSKNFQIEEHKNAFAQHFGLATSECFVELLDGPLEEVLAHVRQSDLHLPNMTKALQLLRYLSYKCSVLSKNVR